MVPWARALTPALILATAVLAACSGSQSDARGASLVDRCASFRAIGDAHLDCMGYCLECGHKDYGPCLASCSGARKPAAILRRAPQPAPWIGPDPEGTAPSYRMVPLALGTLEIDLRLLFAGGATADAASIVVSTHVQQIQSEAVARAAGERLQLASDPDYAPDADAAAARALRSIRARRRGTSAVIEVAITDTIAPDLAVRICNAVMEAHLERMLRIELEARRRQGEPATAADVPEAARVLDHCRSTRPELWGF